MKKIIYLLTVIICLSSCSSSDDDASSSNIIIGTWQLKSETENGVERTTDCTRKSTITFLKNGNGSQISYDESYDGAGNAVCENDYNGTFTWENTNATTYNVSEDGQSNSVELTFSQNNTIFSTSFSETYDGTTYTSTSSYIKI
ncbi:hypothetical protein BTO04_14370 [Polaribacter sp. SA4-10]|uniref:lipocalin family protein n=1 Tax=Polaribacter sp. SA4-10 TaxID=754397 RepID=UPI000B3CF3DB|nr:lipocalin family protein [Polaribacter sp. SA4-10]ARV07806.1 hypothetical protein BTO04_14370 [Polaribacter sp. SA4-10]